MKFREQRGGLDESMRTLRQFHTFNDFLKFVKSLDVARGKEISIRPYGGPDERIGWQETFIVSIKGYGVLGYIDSAPDNWPNPPH